MWFPKTFRKQVDGVNQNFPKIFLFRYFWHSCGTGDSAFKWNGTSNGISNWSSLKRMQNNKKQQIKAPKQEIANAFQQKIPKL